MKKAKKDDRNQLLAVIGTQRAEISALRERVEALEAEDVGELRRRVQELEEWKAQAESRIKQLEEKAAMTQGLLTFIGTAIVALLGERIEEALRCMPFDEFEKFEQKFNEMAGDKLAEIEEQFGEGITKLVQAIQRFDGLSLRAWEHQRKTLERRVSTLPPLKRAMYEGLNRFAKPSKVGTLIFDMLLTSEEFAQKLTPEDKHKMELLTAVIDTFSNLWPLAVTNSLAPMLKHVGFDDAADAAGEILDQLQVSGSVPRLAVRKVHRDLVAMKVIQANTKPSTVIEYFTNGFNLQRLGCSPDDAASFGRIPSSATQLKRAKRAFEGLEQLYNRLNEYPVNVSLEQLETFGQALTHAAQDKFTEMKELIAAELN